jgi:lysophospholipase L1-like esterase
MNIRGIYMLQENQPRTNLKWFRLGLVTAGGVMIIFAFLAGKIGLSTPGNFGKGRLLLVLFGLFLLLVGLLGRRFSNYFKGFALIVLNTILLFLFMELVSTVVLKLHDKLRKSSDTSDTRLFLPYYASLDWARGYFQELNKAEAEQYYPWVIWRNVPFKGSYININQDGIPPTAGADCSPGSYTVFTFGGSTMWGGGAPDWGTIAAYLQADLVGVKNQPVCTINFGENGYVSTQSLIELMIQLEKGNIPNLVIFYDGINDVLAGYQSGQACVHHNLNDIASRFEGRDIQQIDPMIKWLHNSSTFRLLKILVDKFIPERTTAFQTLITYRTMGIDPDSLAASIAKCYFENFRLVGALAQEYGFEYAFFWQPVISIGYKPLTREEREFRTEMDPALMGLYTATYQIIQNSTLERKNLYYIADVFDEQVAQIWVDEMHVTPVGNRLIEQEMLQKLGYQPLGK